MSDEERKYYESEAKRKWQKEHTVLVGVKLQKKGDKDILDYLEKQAEKDPEFKRASAFKEALREKMAREQNNQ